MAGFLARQPDDKVALAFINRLDREAVERADRSALADSELDLLARRFINDASASPSVDPARATSAAPPPAPTGGPAPPSAPVGRPAPRTVPGGPGSPPAAPDRGGAA